MMERAEKAGLGVALVGHAALFAVLSTRLLTPPLPVPPPEQAIEVSLAPDVALQQAAPPAPTPPAPSEAPDRGAPEDAAAPEAPAPPAPEPKPAPPKPEPKPVPPKPKPAPAKPAPAKPQPTKPRPVEPKPAPTAEPKPKPAAKPAPAKPPPKPSARPNPDRLASVVADAERAAARATRAEGASPGATAPRARGSRLGADFLKGLADTPAKAPPSAAAPGAVMSAKATADIASAIQRQIQPCADRQVNPGPGAERIRVAINLKLNRDGSLAAPPRVVNHQGLDVDNRRYLDRVDDLAIAAFVGCSPLRGLPANLYDVPNGWHSIIMNYKLPG